MTEYHYIDDYEREWTQKYEGTYTPEEIERNRQLEKECGKDPIDFKKVEELLKQGADPLGGTAICGWGLLDHIYGTIVGDCDDPNSVNLPRLTELFLKYGMNVDSPRVPYDGDNSINPLWEFSFATNENSISALKMLLDHGLSADSFGEFWGHSMYDFFHIECGDPQNDEYWNKECVWALKMLLLGASYDHIFENDESLRDFIGCSYNTGDVHIFRDWNDFEYRFDTSHCTERPELYGSIVRIYSKKTGNEVWKIAVGKLGKDALEELNQ